MYVHTLMTIWERSTEWSTNRVVHSADWCAVWRFSHCTESEIEWNISRTLLYARVGGYLPAYSSVHHYYYLSAVALFTSADATTLQWANILVVLHHSGSMSLHNYQAHCLHLSRSSSCTLPARWLMKFLGTASLFQRWFWNVGITSMQYSQVMHKQPDISSN